VNPARLPALYSVDIRSIGRGDPDRMRRRITLRAFAFIEAAATA
jgi:hypothetical protein